MSIQSKVKIKTQSFCARDAAGICYVRPTHRERDQKMAIRESAACFSVSPVWFQTHNWYSSGRPESVE